MAVRTITGNVNDLQGVAIPNAVITLIPVKFGFGDAADTLILGDEETFVADASGGITFDTEEGDYALRFQTKQGLKSVFLRVGSEGPWTLGRLVETLTPITNELVQLAFDARDKAQEWATNPEDDAVETGQFSALHHAAKAGASAAAADQSAGDAATSEANAADTFAEFETVYLGAKASDPTLDNEGNALITGAVYFNTTDGEQKYYDGSGWLTPTEIAVDGAVVLTGAQTITGQKTFTGGVASNGGVPLKMSHYTDSAGAMLAESRRARGSSASPTALLAGDQVYRHYVEAHDGTDFRYMIEQKFDLQGWNGIQPYGRFTIRGEDSAGTNKDFFWADGDGAYVNGNLGIGTGAPSQKLDVEGHVTLNQNNLYWSDAAGGDYVTWPSTIGLQGFENGVQAFELAQGATQNTWFRSGLSVGTSDDLPTNVRFQVKDESAGVMALLNGTSFAQMRLQASGNRRFLGVGTDGSTKSQVVFEDDAVQIAGVNNFSSGKLWAELDDDQALFYRTVKAPALAGKFNVKYHGAVGDGVANDSTAVSDALDYALANNGPMELPVGRFRLNSAISKTVTGATRKTGIVGQGQGCSEFFIPSTNTTGGILIDVTGTTDKADQALFRDFSMETDAVGGIGLRFKQEPGGAQDLNTVICENVRLWTDMTGTKYFATAFEFQGAWRPIVKNCFWAGPVFGYDHTTADPALGCNRALDIQDAYDPIIDTCWFKGAKYGVYSSDIRGGNESETIRITKCVMNQVDTGVYFRRSTREPLLFMDFTHINYRQAGLWADGAKVGQIVNNSFYNEDDTSEFTGIPTDIRLQNAKMMIVNQNTFQFTGHPNRVGIFVDSDGEAGAGHDNMISNNIFAEVTLDKAIQIMAGADNNTGSGNMYRGTITTNVADAGTGNTVT